MNSKENSTDLPRFPAVANARPVTMSSRDVAELTGKRHPDVKRDIERLLTDLEEDVSKFAHIYLDSMNREQSEYLLDRDLTENLLLGYSAPLRRKVLARMRELERAVSSGLVLPNFEDPIAAARAWANEREARQLAERTKAEIGSRREATAMATASVATRRANRLEVELDKATSWASVKRMEKHFKPRRFDWRPLKAKAIECGRPPQKAIDANFGEVNTYPAEVWREVYGLEIPHGGAQ